MFDFVEFVNQIATLAAVSVVLVFMLRYRDRVLTAVTGDDRLHISPMDCIYWTVFQCCGTCKGFWTRHITKLPCCPKRWRGMNLVERLGRVAGVVPYTIELKNIVVGDLPTASATRGSFFVQVECGSDPPLVTSVAEDKLPKLVHFPEVMTLRTRWNLLEQSIRITVKAERVFGFEDIAYVHLQALNVVEWAFNPRDTMKRFEMKPFDRHMEHETPCWILLELSVPQDDRDLDNFYADTSTVRTTVRDSGHYRDRNITEFKHEYALLDAAGHVMHEPDEEDLSGIENCETCLRRSARFIFTWGLLLLTGPSIAQVVFYDCVAEYKKITVARMLYPTQTVFSKNELDVIMHECRTTYDGTGTAEGSTPCRPPVTEILRTCGGPNGTDLTAYPLHQPIVAAFPDFFKTVTGNERFIECPEVVCTVILGHNAETTFYTGVAWVIWVTLLLCMRVGGHRWVEHLRHRIAGKLVQARDETLRQTK